MVRLYLVIFILFSCSHERDINHYISVKKKIVQDVCLCGDSLYILTKNNENISGLMVYNNSSYKVNTYNIKMGKSIACNDKYIYVSNYTTLYIYEKKLHLFDTIHFEEPINNILSFSNEGKKDYVVEAYFASGLFVSRINKKNKYESVYYSGLYEVKRINSYHFHENMLYIKNKKYEIIP